MSLPWLDDTGIVFPDISTALQEPNGLLAVGGDLGPERLVAAYRLGIFPWYEDGQPILWWSPDPRMVLLPEQLRISSSLRRLIRKQQYTITMDQDFAGVIDACSQARPNSEGTWITVELKSAYRRLHELGIAHSVEVRDSDELVGGLYGLGIGQLFFGESMFSRRDNTSKLALVFLVEQLRKWHYKLIDCQVSSVHLESLGAREISRKMFQQYLLRYLDKPGKFGSWQTGISPQR
ncbi:MAG: leucyl/phenylalanyl-tRNA--protein transferase [Gammaproteobacteria bacterium]|nr:leucyl/phenylalanyl-tRNA--protein transferase [Gammaproteobacteria bacterium]